MDIFDIVVLLGGLALLLFGMGVMGDALKKSAGNKLKTILSSLTSNPFKGFLLGAIGTVVMQSSSATTVMIVGFVTSGAMTLSQTIPMIIGANVGTTATAWLLSTTSISTEGSIILAMLKPSFFSPVLAVVGLVLYMFGKKEKRHDVGCALLGFAVMMFGMETMSDAVANLPDLSGLFVTLASNPVLGVFTGTVVTAIIQSSAASVGMLQVMSTTGAISLAGAIPIVMGQNTGPCITAIIS
ncbi:MAG: Na/Pi symporter, partial [Clostridia bacterium]|nr:Na/Pi symporter [Clostridia bacterium]